MNRGTLGRIEKIERSQAKAAPPLVVWQEDSGIYCFDGQEWPDIEAILSAYPGQYTADNVMVCSWDSGVGSMPHEEALKFLD